MLFYFTKAMKKIISRLWLDFPLYIVVSNSFLVLHMMLVPLIVCHTYREFYISHFDDMVPIRNVRLLYFWAQPGFKVSLLVGTVIGPTRWHYTYASRFAIRHAKYSYSTRTIGLIALRKNQSFTVETVTVISTLCAKNPLFPVKQLEKCI